MKTVSILVLLIILVVGILSFTGNSQDELVQEKVVEEMQNEVQNNVEEMQNEAQNNQDTEIAPEAELSSGLYTEYSGNLAQYVDKDIVLFFKAAWCPSCRALDNDIKSNLGDIPENVVLLELDYDTETELKKKYKVTTQHTLVQVDTEGNLINKWSGGNRLEDVLSQIN